jgi:hypothetical protein
MAAHRLALAGARPRTGLKLKLGASLISMSTYPISVYIPPRLQETFSLLSGKCCYLLRIARVSVRIRTLVANLRQIGRTFRQIGRALGALEKPWADWRSLRLTCEVQGWIRFSGVYIVGPYPHRYTQ